ncbi:hypothetical protein [Fulvivirga lutea]|uniref:Uncharacterized protein n=1 Tax=Fulvivirga lutea TaxID=2810512 RepID=A0A975A1X8_9BACT|nr:hypothetical protein [Fulvivirga lutea]QSE98695.1 hypothetical protein JR347_06340 [Fulvivirga lutea]
MISVFRFDKESPSLFKQRNCRHFRREMFFVIMLFSPLIYAQKADRPNTIDTRLFPTYNSDFSYFFLRRDMRLYEQMVSTEVIAYEDGAVDVRTKGFVPVHNSKKWTYIIPFYLDRYQYVAVETDDELAVNNLFGQSILTFYPNERWTYLHIIEFRFKGANDYFMKKEGNFLAQFMTVRYNINTKTSITAGGLFGIGWDQNGDSYWDVKPSLAFNWSPNKFFTLMLGVPGAGIEWSAPAGFDIVIHSLMDGEDINTTAAIRKNISSKFDFTFRYLREGYDGLYTPNEAVDFTNDIDLKQISQYQNKVQAELTVRPEDNTVIQFIGGYGTNRKLEALDINGITTDFSSSNGYYLGINLAKTIVLN